MSSTSESSESSSSPFSDTSSPSPQLKRKRAPETFGSDGSDDDSSSSEEAPALSHAEKRRQRKKERPELEQKQSISTSKKRKLDSKDSSATSNRQNSVWVGNLSFKTTTQSLKDFFDGVGEITRVHMPTKAGTVGGREENRGFAYVDFATPEAKVIAISMSEKPLIGRRLLIKDGNDFAGRPAAPGAHGANEGSSSLIGHTKTAQKILRLQKQPPAPTLFLGNLGFQATDKSIRELLEAHRDLKRKVKSDAETPEDGELKGDGKKDVWIRKIRMGTFEDSGLCKGWAFVDFTSIEHATAALVDPKNHRLDGRKLVVEYASADAVRRGGGGVRPKKEAGGDGTKRLERSKGVKRDDRKWTAHNNDEPPATTVTEGNDVSVDQETKRERPPHVGRQVNPGALKGGRHDRVSRNRTKPGAALALAKRETAAIVPSQGRKVKF